MANVVTKRGQPNNSPPIFKLVVPGQVVLDIGVNVRVSGDHIEDDAGEVHHPKRVFKPLVAGTREN